MWDINNDELIDSFQLSRTWRSIFTYSCGGSTIDFQAGCLGGILRPFQRAEPSGCDRTTDPNLWCDRFESFGGIEAEVGLAPWNVCVSAIPDDQCCYVSGTVAGSGSSTRRLIWVGSGPPPSMEVRVITAFRLQANAEAGGACRV